MTRTNAHLSKSALTLGEVNSIMICVMTDLNLVQYGKLEYKVFKKGASSPSIATKKFHIYLKESLSGALTAESI